MAVRIFGIGRGKARLRDRINRLKGDFNDREDALEGVLDRISGQSRGAYADAEMGLNERFGESLDRVEGQVEADRAGAQRSISRALMASGGDVTGEGAAALGEVTASGNRTISDAIRNYTDASRTERRQDLARGDQLLRTEMGGQQNLLNMTLSQLLNKENLDIHRRTANKQLLSDYIGAIGSATGGAIAASDERLKDDIIYLNDEAFESKTGVKLATWKWKENGKKAVGVIAQDMQKEHPEFVIKSDDGFLMVDYNGVHNLLNQEV